MTEAHGYLKSLLANLADLRKQAKLTEAALEERLILGPGWIRRFETSETVPSIDMLLAILHETGAGLPDLLKGLPEPEASTVARSIFAEPFGKDLAIHFTYADHDAKYVLKSATPEQFETVIKTLRDGLSRLGNSDTQQIKTDSVARAGLCNANADVIGVGAAMAERTIPRRGFV